MRTLVCPNTWRNQHVSALSEEMIRVLSQQYDVVVNELSNGDIQESETDYWVYLAIAGGVSAAKVRTALAAAGLQFDDLPANRYRWQEGRIGLQVSARAAQIVAALRDVSTEIIEYTGPNGH